MALQKNSIIKAFNFTESYNVISDIRYSKNGNRVRFIVNSYPNSGSRADNFFNNPVYQKDYAFIADDPYRLDGSSNAIEVCYNYLKTLPEWSGSVDV